MTNIDDVRERFAATAEQVAEHAARQVEAVREELRTLASFEGVERALDAGTGAGTLALALAPLVREVVGVDVVPELLEAARRDAPPNVTFVEGNIAKLDFESFSSPAPAGRFITFPDRSSSSQSSSASRAAAERSSSRTRSHRSIRCLPWISIASSARETHRTRERSRTSIYGTSSRRTGSSSSSRASDTSDGR